MPLGQLSLEKVTPLEKIPSNQKFGFSFPDTVVRSLNRESVTDRGSHVGVALHMLVPFTQGALINARDQAENVNILTLRQFPT